MLETKKSASSEYQDIALRPRICAEQMLCYAPPPVILMQRQLIAGEDETVR
jgi:hypothetical protein